ncbi:Phytosulfokines 3 [Rhynchospora pubera]|uniref:Phytosulfokine n=1 Tax=Rhynchospora pubera TaxID=906938 RepID=A0AAV8CVB5_9POAL|nr:Phytosulfokines 3 [Rhynchospora pubera]
MMSKRVTLALILSLLLFVSLAKAIRPEPAELNKRSHEVSRQLGKPFLCLLIFHLITQGPEEKFEAVNEDDCNGTEEEACILRRTLVAHTDYIYTQGKHN